MKSTSRRKRRQHMRRPDPALAGRSRPLILPASKFTLLTEAQVEQVHEASFSILARTGVVFNEEEAVGYFRQAGARVEENRVYLERDFLEHCLATAPAQYTLHARNPANNVTIGGNHCAVMPGGGPPFVRDLDGRRRPGTLADVENFARLSQMSPEVHVMACKAVEAQDVPVAIRHLECWRAVLTLTDKPAQSGFVNGRAEAEDALQMLAIVFGGEDAIDGTPVAHCSVNANSPLLYDRPMLESLLLFARYGQPVLISPFVMAGVTGPTTLAGALAQHNAEVLVGIALTQLVRLGTPVLYGSASSNVDMRNANPAIGSPESAASIAICAQLARHYNLPCRGGGALTDSPLPDAQSNYERMFTLLTSVLSGVNFLMHGLGILESYLSMSYEQFVIDLELIGMVRHLVQPFDVSAETLALETINHVGPGGHFLEASHTMRHYRQAHFIPRISLRQPHEQWQEEGSQYAGQRAIKQCRELLESYVKPDMEDNVADELHNFVERVKAKLL
ncbi:MAG TPA: trimethylamine methyltransferase family protein [Anaerolineae bacterium]